MKMYVYFIYISESLVYIGVSKDPHKRWEQHKKERIWPEGPVRVDCYGPFKKEDAFIIESVEIAKNKNLLTLKNHKRDERTIKKSRKEAEERIRQGCIQGGLLDKPGMVCYY